MMSFEQIVVAMAWALPEEQWARRNWILSQSQEMAVDLERSFGPVAPWWPQP